MGAPARSHGGVLGSLAGERGCGHWPWRLPDLQVLGLQLVDLRVRGASETPGSTAASGRGRNPGQHRPFPAQQGSEAILTSLCSLRSSSLRLLLTFMSCCTLASEAARAFFSSRYSCSVTAPSDRSEESMLCRGRQAGQSPCCRRDPGQEDGGWAALAPALGCSAWRRRCAGAPGLCPRPRPRCRSRAGRPGRSGPARTARGCLRAQACHSTPGPAARAPPGGSVPWSGTHALPTCGAAQAPALLSPLGLTEDVDDQGGELSGVKTGQLLSPLGGRQGRAGVRRPVWLTRGVGDRAARTSKEPSPG